MEMQQELKALVAKYGNNSNLSKELKKLQGGDATKRSKLEAALDKVIAEYGTITLTRFKKEASKAWHRAFPEGVEKREVKGYQLFVKENMQRVKEENPGKTHVECMAIIGKMWQDSKGAAPVEPTTEHTPSTANTDEGQDDDTSEDEEPVRRGKRGGKRARTPPPVIEIKKRTRRG